ncbi:unnamed protein product [Phytophthora lilii]|uniref:Unnamed protein product n=1 Tax=Phytophthora lilii TaxID=2077276 RepID=A0A9W7CP92_9STRA|nr:unnamed protein product [Phytophthora lilii]
MTAVALDEDNRPYRGLPQLVDPSNDNRIERLQEIAQQRKDLSMRLKRTEETVDQMPSISMDMLVDTRTGEWSDEVAVKDTVVALSTSFLPRHLNRNGTVFGGEILSWMVRSCYGSGSIRRDEVVVADNLDVYRTRLRCTAAECSLETATW